MRSANTTPVNPRGSVDEVILARDLRKSYVLGERGGLRWSARLLMRRGDGEGLRAIDGVSLSIRGGEMLGIVGGNGSGKTTLLQMIAGITRPTEGHLDVRGRVLPLLAVGTGFHPELTGAENIVLFGAILGLPREVARQRIPSIADFGGLSRHIDTPIKRYSDGMSARLSFAVAMGFPADIYLFDEVLAVVDSEFRERCIEQIRNLARSGSTVIFVSHQAEQTRTLCDRVLWLERGRVRELGPSAGVMDRYASRERDPA